MDSSTREQIERARRMTPDERFREGLAYLPASVTSSHRPHLTKSSASSATGSPKFDDSKQ